MDRGRHRASEEAWSAECSRLGIRVAPVEFGVGVFATREFAAGDVIGVIRGRVIDDPGYASAYVIELSDRLGLEPEGPLREVNHSCEPNCWLSVDADAGTATLHAARAIDAGQELVIDYAWPMTDDPVVCACDSKSCRLWIVAAGETASWPYLLAYTRWEELPAGREEKLKKRFG